MLFLFVFIILAILGSISFAILKGSMKIAFKVLLNTVVGFIALWFINFFGSWLGISIGVNWFNALIVGVFGVPGVALLLILQWLMMI